MLGIDLSLEGAPFVQEALRRSVLINCTHDHILRLLPPFVIRRRDVSEFLERLEEVLARAQKRAAKHSAQAAKIEIEKQPLALAAVR